MIGAVATRLTANVPALRTVRGVGSLAALTPGADRASAPAAYVHLVGDRAGGNQLVRGVSQRLTRRVGVLLSLTATAEERGSELADPLEELVDAVRTALVGWSPAADASPLTLESGTLQSLASGSLWWRQIYATDDSLRVLA